MIRPAKCHFDGFIKAFIKGADKNHNPRKGTETFCSFHVVSLPFPFRIRTIIPARGRKLRLSSTFLNFFKCDKNHNPRKGTETSVLVMLFPFPFDKNHNPRKGTETRPQGRLMASGKDTIRTIIPARGRKLCLA